MALGLAISAEAASAATQLGSTCIASGGISGVAHFDPANGTAASDGVITKWGFAFPIAPPPTNPQQLIVFAPTSLPFNYSVVATSDPLAVAAGGSSAAVQIPIKKGQIIGTWGAAAGLYCNATTSTMLGVSAASLPPVGAFVAAGSTANETTAVYANVEPDVDGDGFGDETQDSCPQSAKFHTPCPAPKLSAVLGPSTKSFSAFATADTATTLVASASVTLPAHGKKKAKKLTFAGKPINIAPGLLTTVKLPWPSALKQALSSVSKTKSLKVSVTLTANGVLSNGVQKFTVKLSGTK